MAYSPNQHSTVAKQIADKLEAEFDEYLLKRDNGGNSIFISCEYIEHAVFSILRDRYIHAGWHDVKIQSSPRNESYIAFYRS